MKDIVETRLAANAGVVSAAELVRLGFGRQAVARLVATGTLRRVRHGAYVDPDRWAAGNAVERQVLEARAVLSTLDGYAASHLTAVALLGLPVVATSLGPLEVCRVGDPVWRSRSGVRARGGVPVAACSLHRGVRVVTPALAVRQVSRMSVRDGLMAADAALARGLLTRGELSEPVALSTREPLLPSRGERLVADLASALSESPGESWTRYVFHVLELPQPEQQAVIRDAEGNFVARVDFLFRAARVVVEFDGAVKYAGAQGRAALVAEKRREDRLRALGYRVVRLTWQDLRHPDRVLRLLGEVEQPWVPGANRTSVRIGSPISVG